MFIMCSHQLVISATECRAWGSLLFWIHHTQCSFQIRYIDSEIIIVKRWFTPSCLEFWLVQKSVSLQPTMELSDKVGQGRLLQSHSSFARDHTISCPEARHWSKMWYIVLSVPHRGHEARCSKEGILSQ